MLLVFLLYALFASVFTVAKGTVEYVSPFFLVGSRMLVAGLVLLVYAFWKDPTSVRLSRSSVSRVLLLGCFNIYLTNVLELWGLQYLTSFKTCFLYSLSPFLSALFSYLILRERMTEKKWWGLVIGFSGFLPILLKQSHEELLTGSFWWFSGAELAVIGAVSSSVIGWILLRQLVRQDQCSPCVANGYSMLFGGLCATVHSLWSETWSPLPVRDYAVWLEGSLFLIIVSNFLCYNLYAVLLRRFSPTFMAFAGLSTPIFTAIFGWIFHQEVVTVWFFISLFVVFLGLLIFYFEELRIGRELLPSRDEISREETEVLLPRTVES